MFSAKFKSRCGSCQKIIRPGDPLEWQHFATQKRAAVHQQCEVNIQDTLDELIAPILCPTEEQQYIIELLLDSQKHILASAGPGCGKTATAHQGGYELLRYADPKHLPKIFYATFTNALADQLKELFSHILADASTLHSFGSQQIREAQRYTEYAVLQAYDNWPGNKLKYLFQHKLYPEFDSWSPAMQGDAMYRFYHLKKLIDLAKANAIYPDRFLQHLPLLAERYDIDLPDEQNRPGFFQEAYDLYMLSVKDRQHLDFADMQFFVVYFEIIMKHYDYIFVDEFQDLSKMQVLMLIQMAQQSGARLIVTYDAMQEIYGFRGAGTYVELLKEHFDFEEAMLKICFRTKNLHIMERLQLLDPTLKPCDQAKYGAPVDDVDWEEMVHLLKGRIGKCSLAVESRTNALLLSTFYEGIRQDVPMTIWGKDFGQELVNLVLQFSKNTSDMNVVYRRMEQWLEKKITQYEDKPTKQLMYQDKFDCLAMLCKKGDDVDQVVGKVDRLFSSGGEKNGKVNLMTVHKAKGHEFDEGYVIVDVTYTSVHGSRTITYIPFDYGEYEEEKRVQYVAYSRFLYKLGIVHKNV